MTDNRNNSTQFEISQNSKGTIRKRLRERERERETGR
jgi:hypothetical protein